MATKQPESGGPNSHAIELSGDDASSQSSRKKGGWTTFPFIIGELSSSSFTGSYCILFSYIRRRVMSVCAQPGSYGMLTVAAFGAFANLVVYLVQQFNVDRITAAQILNVFLGSTNIAPVAGAIISDSYLGCFLIFVISSIISIMVCPFSNIFCMRNSLSSS
jgi:peptide/histidine transporter 3/4